MPKPDSRSGQNKKPCLWLEGATPRCEGADMQGWETLVVIFAICPPVLPAQSFKHSYSHSSFRPRLACRKQKEQDQSVSQSTWPGRQNQQGTVVTYTHLGDTHAIHTQSCLGRSERRHLAWIVLPGRRQCSWPPGNLIGY